MWMWCSKLVSMRVFVMIQELDTAEMIHKSQLLGLCPVLLGKNAFCFWMSRSRHQTTNSTQVVYRVRQKITANKFSRNFFIFLPFTSATITWSLFVHRTKGPPTCIKQDILLVWFIGIDKDSIRSTRVDSLAFTAGQRVSPKQITVTMEPARIQ